MKREELTQEIVRELLDYEPETGVFTWKERDIKYFSDSTSRSAKEIAIRWNTRYSLKAAFTKGAANKYSKGSVLDVYYDSHRIAYLWMTGEWPDFIDHINGIKNDNRWINIRNVSKKENHRNMKKPRTNTSGILGVEIGHKGKFLARIRVNSKTIHLGTFEEKEQAAAARKAAEIKYGFHENHGRES